MTDLFAIDFENEGFRRNTLDWRKFRANYTRVSASKVERGIKPLPLSLLLKLLGPQKVLNTYVVTRRATSDLDYLATVADRLTAAKQDLQIDMQGADRDMAVPKTLTFPGDGLFTAPEDSAASKQSPGKKSKGGGSKRDALPSRPAFQRNVNVPGRYFPKTSYISDEIVSHSVDLTRDRPRTRTPRSYIVQTPSSIPPETRTRSQQSGFYNRSSSRVVRGPVCKATDTYSANSKRASNYSGRSGATVRSIPAFNSSDFTRNGRADMLYVDTRNGERIDTGSVPSETLNGDSHVDFFNMKRLRLSNRQVSFPGKSNVDFSTVLQGRPKTLHRRDLMDSEMHLREPRAKTHVGFVE